MHIKETQSRSQIHLKELTTLASICVHLYHTKYKPMELGKNAIEEKCNYHTKVAFIAYLVTYIQVVIWAQNNVQKHLVCNIEISKIISITNFWGHILVIIVMWILYFHWCILPIHRFYASKTCMKHLLIRKKSMHNNLEKWNSHVNFWFI